MTRSRSASVFMAAVLVVHGCGREGSQEPPGEVAAPPSTPPPAAPPIELRPEASAEDGAERDVPPVPHPVPAWSERLNRIAIGRTHVCVLDSGDRHPICWGDPREGRIGSTLIDEQDPVQLPAVTAVSLVAGDAHTCGLTSTGEVVCWGSNAQGQLGIDGTSTTRPTALALDGRARQLAAGGAVTCAIVEDGGLSCWLPGGPAQRFEGTDLVRVAVGPGHDGCALDSKGMASCWRLPESGPAGASALRAAAVEGLPPSVDVGVGDGFACALGQDAIVRCWGSNEGQRLGLPTAVAEQRVPAPVPELPGDIVQLAVGSRSSCALQRGGATWCWGVGTEGQLGRGAPTASAAAARVRGLPAATEVIVGHSQACVLEDEDTPWCWGLEAGMPFEPVTEVAPAALVAISDIEHCATDRDGRVGCWEPNVEGSTIFVEGVRGASDLALPDGGGCAVVERRARCWGGGAMTKRHPDRGFDDDRAVHSMELEDVRSVTAIMERVCAIDGKSRVSCWGLSDPPESSGGEVVPFGPTRVEGLEGAEQLAMSRFQLDCARRADGALVCWPPARMDHTRMRLRASKVAGMPAVVAIAGDQTVLAVTTDDEVWSVDGETLTPQKLPVVLPRPAKAIATSVDQTCVLFQDGEVGCWANHDADLAESPITVVPVHGLADVVRLVAKTEHACAVQADGSAACWTLPPPRIAEAPTKSEALRGYRVEG